MHLFYSLRFDLVGRIGCHFSALTNPSDYGRFWLSRTALTIIMTNLSGRRCAHLMLVVRWLSLNWNVVSIRRRYELGCYWEFIHSDRVTCTMYQIVITGYHLVTMPQGKPYYVYTIEMEDTDNGRRYLVERRYSEFNSLHRMVSIKSFNYSVFDPFFT